MFGHYSYLIFMLFFVIIALAILWGRYHKELWLHKDILLKVAIIGIIYQLIVDPFAGIWKTWLFSPNLVMGIWIFNFPIEEILFFALTSFAVACAVIAFITHQKRHNASLR